MDGFSIFTSLMASGTAAAAKRMVHLPIRKLQPLGNDSTVLPGQRIYNRNIVTITDDGFRRQEIRSHFYRGVDRHANAVYQFRLRIAEKGSKQITDISVVIFRMNRQGQECQCQAGSQEPYPKPPGFLPHSLLRIQNPILPDISNGIIEHFIHKPYPSFSRRLRSFFRVRWSMDSTLLLEK